MALRRLCKSGNSHVDGECPAVYVDDDPTMMIGQGTVLDPTRAAELRDVAADEAGVSRWVTPADRAEWTSLFTDYQRSAYRLEAQQVYCSAAMDDDLAQFLSGRPVEVDWTWLREVTGPHAAAGRAPVKVRVVVEPVTPYTAMELTLYPRMAEIGEDIRIIATRQGSWPDGVPHHDYWMFDERQVWRMHYHENFRFAGAELLDDPHVVAEHRRWRDRAVELAVPLADHLAVRGDAADREHHPA